MNCHLTEKVSLLIDAELAPVEAARLSAHIETCAPCAQAREAFLSLRQQIRLYEFAPDPLAQRQALSAILSTGKTGATADGRASTLAGATADRRTLSARPRWRERLADAFNTPRLKPALVAALVLLVLGAVVGVRLSRRTADSSTPAARIRINDMNTTPPSSAVARVEDKPEGAKGGGVVAVETPAAKESETIPVRTIPAWKNRDAGVEKRLAALRRGGTDKSNRIIAGGVSPDGQVAGTSARGRASAARDAAAPDVSESVREEPAEPPGGVVRHVEQAELLLRGFSNARFVADDPTFDVAYARRRSRRLLYQNIILRREAASKGDLPVEDLLGGLEPILLDISNLPDKPSREAVGSIKARMGRKQIVGVLQVQSALAARRQREL